LLSGTAGLNLACGCELHRDVCADNIFAPGKAEEAGGGSALTQSWYPGLTGPPASQVRYGVRRKAQADKIHAVAAFAEAAARHEQSGRPPDHARCLSRMNEMRMDAAVLTQGESGQIPVFTVQK